MSDDDGDGNHAVPRGDCGDWRTRRMTEKYGKVQAAKSLNGLVGV